MKNLTNEHRYLLKEAIEEKIERLETHLDSLSIDDYNLNGHNIEYDISYLYDLLHYIRKEWR